MKPFPVGGPREPVYNFLRQYGFEMGRSNDKHWNRSADGVTLHLYGAGSMARVFNTRTNEVLVEGAPLREAVKRHYGDKSE